MACDRTAVFAASSTPGNQAGCQPWNGPGPCGPGPVEASAAQRFGQSFVQQEVLEGVLMCSGVFRSASEIDEERLEPGHRMGSEAGDLCYVFCLEGAGCVGCCVAHHFYAGSNDRQRLLCHSGSFSIHLHAGKLPGVPGA